MTSVIGYLYLAIGIAFSLWMPWYTKRSLARANTCDPNLRASLSHDDRQIFDSAVDALKTKYNTAQLMVAGLLWPLFWLALLLGNRMIRKARR